MNKSLLWIGIGAIVVIAIAYFAFMQSPSTPETNRADSMGKLNINAICDGALAYMTFSTGAEADAFVQACKEGKHPEVIEKYKADMNLGAGVAI